MIRARNVTVRVGPKTLVSGIDLDVADGERIAIVGPNGAGKSTLLGAISGDRALAAGTVRLADRDVHAQTPAELARLRAVLPQRSALSLAFTATEVVQFAHRATTAAEARTFLAAVELPSFADRIFPSLSGGEQQRVQLARVLAQLARAPGAALLLDEPTSALDPRHQLLVLRLARDAAERGHPVIAVLHDLTLAARWADRVIVLGKGALIAAGPPTEVLVPTVLDATYGTPFEVIRTDAGIAILAA